MADDEKGDSSWKLRKFDGSFEDLLTLLVEKNELSKQEKGAAYLWDEGTQERVLSLARKDDVETALGAIKSKFPPSVGDLSSFGAEQRPEIAEQFAKLCQHMHTSAPKDVLVKRKFESTDKKEDSDEDEAQPKKRKVHDRVAQAPPEVVEPISGANFYLAGPHDALCIREPLETAWRTMWLKAEQTMKTLNECVVFIVTGSPGLGKSWGANYIVWQLLQKKQNIWLHSAQEECVVVFKYSAETGQHIVTAFVDSHFAARKPPRGTWYVYDSPGVKHSKARPLPTPVVGTFTVVLSSPKTQNYQAALDNLPNPYDLVQFEYVASACKFKEI